MKIRNNIIAKSKKAYLLAEQKSNNVTSWDNIAGNAAVKQIDNNAKESDLQNYYGQAVAERFDMKDDIVVFNSEYIGYSIPNKDLRWFCTVLKESKNKEHMPSVRLSRGDQ